MLTVSTGYSMSPSRDIGKDRVGMSASVHSRKSSCSEGLYAKISGAHGKNRAWGKTSPNPCNCVSEAIIHIYKSVFHEGA